jgi:hypothetical protein
VSSGGEVMAAAAAMIAIPIGASAMDLETPIVLGP